MRKSLLLMAALLGASVLCVNAQSVKIKGVLEMNRYDDGEQLKSTYISNGKFVVDNGIYATTWNGTSLSTPTKEPEVSVAQARADEDYAQWAWDFNLMAGNSGAVYVDGKIVTVSSRDEQSTVDEELFAVRKWDAVTGNLLSGRNDYFPKSADIESAGMSYNPIDGKVYGLFYITALELSSQFTDDPDYFVDQDGEASSTDAGYCLCSIDLNTMEITPITPGLYYYNFITFAINSEGRAFALTSGGSAAAEGTDGRLYDVNNKRVGAQLCEFDLTTGLMKQNATSATDPETGESYTEYTNIYEEGTGYGVQYHRQAACFAKSNPNKMYWIGDYNCGKGFNDWGSWSTLNNREWKTNGLFDTALYEVDITTGMGTRLAKVPNRCRFSALWIDGDDCSDGTGASGVELVKATPATDGAIYNLAGQRVSDSYRGVVIKDGKKMVK